MKGRYAVHEAQVHMYLLVYAITLFHMYELKINIMAHKWKDLPLL